MAANGSTNMHINSSRFASIPSIHHSCSCHRRNHRYITVTITAIIIIITIISSPRASSSTTIISTGDMTPATSRRLKTERRHHQQ